MRSRKDGSRLIPYDCSYCGWNHAPGDADYGLHIVQIMRGVAEGMQQAANRMKAAMSPDRGNAHD